MASRRTRQQWVSLMATFEGSNLSAAKFCAVRGLTLATFRWWRSQLRRGGMTAALEPVRLLAVDVAEPPIAVAASVVVVFSGLEVRAEVGTDPGYVGALVAELRARC